MGKRQRLVAKPTNGTCNALHPSANREKDPTGSLSKRRAELPNAVQPRSRLTMHASGALYQAMSLHVVFALLIIEFTLLFGSSILVLLVLRHEIVHVALGFRKLHLVHALAGVPMQESLAAEHRGEVLRDALEHLLDGS